MNAGLLRKSLHETGVTTTLFVLGAGLASGLITHIIPTLFDQLPKEWLEVPFIANILKALVGTDAFALLGPESITSIAWAHPIILSLFVAHAIIFCSRVPAGEIDRGTIDVLLGLPISRRKLYHSESLACLGAGIVMVGAALAGNYLGGRAARAELDVPSAPLLKVALNLLCLYLAFSGLTLFVSCLSERRGRAVGVVFAVVVASFLLNFLAPFNEIADKLSFLGVLDYYRPLIVVRDNTWPVDDMLVLCGVAVIFWIAGGIALKRRDICTV